jgi:hypothetical protein
MRHQLEQFILQIKVESAKNLILNKRKRKLVIVKIAKYKWYPKA